MIKKLQNKLIRITMIVISIVVFLLVGVANGVNYIKFNNDTNEVMDVIIENEGTMPVPSLPIFKDPKEDDMFMLETPFKTRYFSAIVEDSKIVNINLNNIYTVNKDEVSSYIAKANDSNLNEGFIGTFKYRIANKGDHMLYVFIDCGQELQNIETLALVSSSTGIFAIIVILVLIILFSRIAVKPIVDSYDKQKQFITDANHEIKTPLTIISANNDVLEMQYGENEWTSSITNQVKRLKELTDKLVFLSKMEEDNSFELTYIDLSKIIYDEAKAFEVLAISSNKEYKLNIEENVKAKANQTLIVSLVSILLDNAFKYTHENDKISISLVNVGKHVKISVKNTVDTIEKGNLDYLFERFYRLDKSRNSSTGGSGIGLSIAKAISNIHKGKISARSDDGKSIQIDFII